MAMKTMFISLIIVVMAASVTEAQNPIGIVHVNGTLYCSPTGNGNTFSGRVLGRCSSICINQRDHQVYLVVLILRPNATVNSIVSSCRLSVLTPLSTCNPTLPSAGLVSNLKFVKIVPVTFWSITYLVASGFTLQT